MPIDPNQPVILLASSRSAGNTFAFARNALPEGCASLIDLSKLNVGYFSYSYANADDDFLSLVEQLVLSPVWVLATPLYWYTMSAQAKTFIDRLSDLLSFRKSLGYQLRGKGLAVICTGSDSALPSAFNQPFELSCDYLGMSFLGTCYAQYADDHLVSVVARQSASDFGSELCSQAANALNHQSTECQTESKLV